MSTGGKSRWHKICPKLHRLNAAQARETRSLSSAVRTWVPRLAPGKSAETANTKFSPRSSSTDGKRTTCPWTRARVRKSAALSNSTQRKRRKLPECPTSDVGRFSCREDRSHTKVGTDRNGRNAFQLIPDLRNEHHSAILLISLPGIPDLGKWNAFGKPRWPFYEASAPAVAAAGLLRRLPRPPLTPVAPPPRASIARLNFARSSF